MLRSEIVLATRRRVEFQSGVAMDFDRGPVGVSSIRVAFGLENDTAKARVQMDPQPDLVPVCVNLGIFQV
jgi:hypothetical protein